MSTAAAAEIFCFLLLLLLCLRIFLLLFLWLENVITLTFLVVADVAGAVVAVGDLSGFSNSNTVVAKQLLL